MGKSPRLLITRYFLSSFFITCLQFITCSQSMSPSAKTEPNQCSRPWSHGIKVLVWNEPSECHRAQRTRFRKFMEKFHENDPLEPEFSLTLRWPSSIATLRPMPERRHL